MIKKTILIIFALYLIGVSHAQVVLHVPQWKTQGPYLDKSDTTLDTTKHCAIIQNLYPEPISGKLKVSIFRNSQLLCEPQISQLPNLPVGAMSSKSYPVFDLTSSDPFIYYDTAFQDSLKNCMIDFGNGEFEVKIEFIYDYGGASMTSGIFDVPIINEPVSSIETMYPKEDTLTETASEIV